MKFRILILLIFLIAITKSTFSILHDQLNFFSETDKQNLENKIEDMKRSYDIGFEIYIVQNEELNLENDLNNLEKSVIIILNNYEENRIRLDMKITNDIDVLGYEDTIDSFLTNTQNLIKNENYVDYIYEIMGSIVDIVTLSELEKTKIRKQERNKRIRMVLLIALICVMIIFLYMAIYSRKIDRKMVCKKCNIDLDLLDEYYDGKDLVRIYNCKICGYTRKNYYRD